MNAHDRPLYVRITGPRGANYVTVGRVYRVVNWRGTAPIIRDDDGDPWALGVAGCVGSRLYPAWEPCGPPPTLEALKAEGDALRAENAALRAEVAALEAANGKDVS